MPASSAINTSSVRCRIFIGTGIDKRTTRSTIVETADSGSFPTRILIHYACGRANIRSSTARHHQRIAAGFRTELRAKADHTKTEAFAVPAGLYTIGSELAIDERETFGLHRVRLIDLLGCAKGVVCTAVVLIVGTDVHVATHIGGDAVIRRRSGVQTAKLESFRRADASCAGSNVSFGVVGGEKGR